MLPRADYMGVLADNAAGLQTDWASPPGETLRDLMEERGLDAATLASWWSWPVEHVEALLDGRLPVMHDVAAMLESLFGTPARFWLRREAAYREDLRRIYEAKKDVPLDNEQLKQACANVGVDLDCGACAEVFFTGSTTHEHTCKAGRGAPKVEVTSVHTCMSCEGEIVGQGYDCTTEDGKAGLLCWECAR